jgi:hypothetical protein
LDESGAGRCSAQVNGRIDRQQAMFGGLSPAHYPVGAMTEASLFCAGQVKVCCSAGYDRLWQILLQKSFRTGDQKFSGP